MSDHNVLSFLESDPESIESIIRAAKDYVHPSDELRPRIVEAAKDRCGDCRAEQRFSNFAIAVLVLILVSSPTLQLASMMSSRIAKTSAEEIQIRAEALSRQSEIGSHWALAEAYSQWRYQQASRLGVIRYPLK